MAYTASSMRPPKGKIRVLVVDDSAVVRHLFTRELSRDPDIEVIGSAVDPCEARDMILKLEPDVITLDIEMPRMDGITFLRKLMHFHAIPVVIVSSIAPKSGAVALEALKIGAVDVLCKPGSSYDLGDLSVQLIDTIKAASLVRIGPSKMKARPRAVPTSAPRELHDPINKVIAIGSSTGGPEALRHVLPSFPANSPGILVVQHMPEAFTGQFAKSLDRVCAMHVKEAANGDPIIPGQVLIAPGAHHLLLRSSGEGLIAQVQAGPFVNRHRPSVDVLFKSVATHAGNNAIGVIMTGMGDDGARGMLQLRNAGAETIAQDKNSSVVFGMPRVAIDLGGVKQIVPLRKIADKILDAVEGGTKSKPSKPSPVGSK